MIYQNKNLKIINVLICMPSEKLWKNVLWRLDFKCK